VAIVISINNNHRWQTNAAPVTTPNSTNSTDFQQVEQHHHRIAGIIYRMRITTEVSTTAEHHVPTDEQSSSAKQW
jgi:hypothetical protein